MTDNPRNRSPNLATVVPDPLALERALEQAAWEFALQNSLRPIDHEAVARTRLQLRAAARAMVSGEQATARLLALSKRETRSLAGVLDDDEDGNGSCGFGGYDGL